MAQYSQRVVSGVIYRAVQLERRLSRISRKGGPVVLHVSLSVVLGNRRRNAADGVIVAKHNPDVGTVVGAAAIMKTRVSKVAPVEELPGRDAVDAALVRCNTVGEDRGGTQKSLSFFISNSGHGRCGRGSTVALFVFAVA